MPDKKLPELSKLPLIDSVPGVERSNEDQEVSRAGDRVPVEFVGDPRRVPGHPSNPFNGLGAALLKDQPESGHAANGDSNDGEQLPELAEGAIREVPDRLKVDPNEHWSSPTTTSPPTTTPPTITTRPNS